LLYVLRRIEHGSIELRDQGSVHSFGQGLPTACIEVYRPRFYRRVVLSGSVGAGESYADGDWDCDDLVVLVGILLRNRNVLDRLSGSASALAAIANRAMHSMRRNSERGSARNIAAHYDLSNAFFATFLDQSMMYSSAVFDRPQATLEQASEAKLARLCAKLELSPSDHLLEIGTGWGGLAIYAARTRGCRVTTTTISAEQYREASRRVASEGLSARVTVLKTDYRQITGTFDKLVSVEMVEAVGNDYLDGYFRTCGQLLAPGGLFALQAITIRDQQFRRALTTVDFIKKHIFPGSFIPSVSRLVASAAENSDTVLVHLEDLGDDYATTLRAWRDRFEANRAEVERLGFDERFVRLWRFYLAYCEGGFRERAISDVQLTFAGHGYRGRPWRAG
jgi:cyclopropane-fatty-acyl-phospholipid synthase